MYPYVPKFRIARTLALYLFYFFLICVFRVVYVSCVCVCVSLMLRTVIDCIVNCSYKLNKETVKNNFLMASGPGNQSKYSKWSIASGVVDCLKVSMESQEASHKL